MATQVEILTGLVNVAIPEVYQKGMSYYEVLTAVVNKVNELIEQSNEYFGTNLKVILAEIIGDMQASGELDQIIADTLTTGLNDVNTAIGDRVYTQRNYIADAQTLTDSLDALDMTLKSANDQFADYGQNIKELGATGDGVTDDTTAINNAMLTAVDGDVFLFPSGTYLIEREITISKRVKIIGHNAIIKFSMLFDDLTTNTLSAFYVTADEVEITGLIFDGSAKTNEAVNNRFVWIDGDNVNIHSCWFKSLDNGGNNFNGAIGFSNQAHGGNVSNCYFNDCPGSVFTKAPRTRISNCTATAPKDVSFALNGDTCIGSSVIGCKVYSFDRTCSIHIGIEETASESIITDNYIFGVKDGVGIGFINVARFDIVNGGIVKNNIVDGGNFVSTSPSALINISDNYKNMIISGNRFINAPSGVASNACALLAPNEMTFSNNYIDLGNGTYPLLIMYSKGAQYALNCNNNVIKGRSTSQLVRINGGHSSRIFIFNNNILKIGLEGLSYNAATSLNMYFYNNYFESVTNDVNSPDGFINNSFNLYNSTNKGGWVRANKVLYNTAPPTGGTWAVGDIVYHTAPGAGSFIGWVCVTAGSPGTWKTFGAITA